MSEYPTEDQQHMSGEAPEEEFITNQEVDQEVIDDENYQDGDFPVDEDDEEEPQDIQRDDENDMEQDEDTLEIDMSNNSMAYFDKHTDSVFTVFTHPTLPLVCSGGGDNAAYLWTSHSQPPKFAGSVSHTESVIGGGFTPDGQYLVTADMNGQILVHKATNGGAKWKECAKLQEVEEVVWIKIHPTVSGVFAFGSTDGSVWCYQVDSKTGQLEQIMSQFVHQADCTMGEFINVEEGDSNLSLVTCSVDCTIIGWSCYTSQQIFKVTKAEIKGIEAPWVSLSKAPISMTKNTQVIACGANNGVLSIINCTNGAVLQLSTVIELKEDQDDLDGSIESIAWSPKLSLMAIGLVCGEILLYDTLTWRVRHKFVLPDSVTKLQFDESTGFTLIAACIDGKVYLFDARTGSELHKCVGHNMGVLDFALIENDKKLITAGDEGVSLIFQLP
ncbi:LANO_0F10154g1_1 [Lachancea nothofagi CBS 11611]|uniref:LANO_0F10154g1_1 n=1 Tax=Lachancea nothofagi CBS 11611 TaxID=1266666 RepID=A0A1G4KA93_9SACH|nr:LANO_0F10154g1_1 [Lachancea nothofagi CBS 11611]